MLTLAFHHGLGDAPNTPTKRLSRTKPWIHLFPKVKRNNAMSFGIIRVRKLTSMTAVSNTDTHNFRLYEERGIEPPENIKAEKWAKNSVSRLNSQITQSDTTIQKIIDERGIKTRKNNVLALEYVVALSPDCKDFYKMGYDTDAVSYTHLTLPTSDLV